MKYFFVSILLFGFVAFSSAAEELQVKSDAPKKYVVKKGDTLWDISTLYLDAPWKWPQLWQWNPDISNPDLIYPGNVLMLQFDDEGKPRLVINNQDKTTTTEQSNVMATKKKVTKVKKPHVRQKIRLSPKARVVVQKNRAIPTLPLAILEPFLSFDQALSQDEVNSLPFVLGANVNSKMNTVDQLLYVKGDLNPSSSYGIYRKVSPYIDLATGKELAYKTKLIGTARVSVPGNLSEGLPSTVKVEIAKQEIKPQDVLLPISQGQSFAAQFSMSRPTNSLNGVIIDTDNNLREFGSMTVVVLNIGANKQLKEGHILDIEKQSPTVIEAANGPSYLEDANSLEKFVSKARKFFGDDNTENSVVWTMPKEKIGELMVFKVYDNISYAMITKSVNPIRVGDSVSVN